MAYYEMYFPTSTSKITGKICINSVSNGSSANTSNVCVSVYFSRGSGDNTNSYGHTNTGVQCDSQSQWENNYLVYVGKNGDYGRGISFAKWFYNIPHNNDGTKSCYFRVCGNSGCSIGNFDSNWWLNLDTIPRYTSINTWSISEIGKTYVKMNWGTSDAVDWTCVYLNNSGKKTNIPVDSKIETTNSNSTSGNFIYYGEDSSNESYPSKSTLIPGTTYELKLGVRRKDSQLWTYSSNVSFTTNPVATIQNLNKGFLYTIGDNLDIIFSNYNQNKSWLSFSVWNKTTGLWEEVLKTDEVIQTESYAWSLSNYASLLYSKCSSSNSVPCKIMCGTTITENDYTIEYISNEIEGTMNVENSNPIFKDFDLADEDNDTQLVLGNTSYMIQGYGDMVVRIPVSKKAVSKNGAEIVCYMIDIEGVGTRSDRILFRNDKEISYKLGNFSKAGVCKVSIYAIDTRWNHSETITKTFTVLDYSIPKFSDINLKRLYEYEQEITLDFTALYSKLSVNGKIKNTNNIIKYRYAESGSTFDDDYKIINGSTIDDNTDDVTRQLIFSQNTKENTFGINGEGSSKKLILNNNKLYIFEFLLIDSFKSEKYQVVLNQGVPIFFMGDNGQSSVGMIPDITRKEKFQVNSDIMGINTRGEKTGVFATLDNMIIYSEIEPENQPLNGLWIPVVDEG